MRIGAEKGRATALVLAGLVIGMLLISPVSAHFTTSSTHLSRHAWKFIKPKVYTRGQAETRFIDAAEVDTLLNSTNVVNVPCGDWVPFSGSPTPSPGRHSCAWTSGGASSGRGFSLPVDLPAVLLGNRVRVTGFEICYEANADAVLGLVEYDVATHSTGAPSGTIALLDNNDRTDSACRFYTLDVLLTPEQVINFVLGVDYKAAATLRIGRASVEYERSTTAAPALSRPGGSAGPARAPNPDFGEA